MLVDYGLRTVFGIIGNIIAFFLFLAAIPTFIKIWRAKSVKEFKPDPYLAAVLSCSMWILYAVPSVQHLNHFWVLTINSAGLGIVLVYITLFFAFSNWPNRKKIIIALLCELVFMAIVVVITLLLLHGTRARSMFVGVLCLIFNIVLFASPLTAMCMTIRTKSVKFMPFYLTLAGFLNSIVWLVYAIIDEPDPYLMIPNGLGAVVGAIQLILFGIFYIWSKWDAENRPPEVQLSENA